MFEVLRSWRRPFMLTLFLNLDPAHDRLEVAKAIGDFEKHLKASADPVMERIHFFRIFTFPGREKGNDRIAFSVVFDGEKIDFLNQLVADLRAALIPIMKNVVGFNRLSSKPSDMELAQWILSQDHKPAAYHVGSVWNSLKQIKHDREMYMAISDFLDQPSDLAQQPPQEIKRRIEAMLTSRLPNVPTNIPPNSQQEHRIRFAFLRGLDALTFLSIVCLIPAVPAALIIFVMGWASASVLWLKLLILLAVTFWVAIVILLATAVFVRYLERTEQDVELRPKDEHVCDVVSKETVEGQNQMTLVVDVKDSFARRTILSMVLWVANAVSRHWYIRGKLVGIDTIHFARFFLIDGKRKMVFMSDYDGSWSRYLLDFTGPGSLAVVPIWSSLEGCPKARFLRWPEVGFEDRFLPFTRCCQHKAQCWFSNYPKLSVSEIKRNEKIRDGLFKPATDQEILDWLALFNGGANV